MTSTENGVGGGMLTLTLVDESGVEGVATVDVSTSTIFVLFTFLIKQMFIIKTLNVISSV